MPRAACHLEATLELPNNNSIEPTFPFFRVLIVQDPLSRVLSAYGDDLLAKTGIKLTTWDDSKRAAFSEVQNLIRKRQLRLEMLVCGKGVGLS